MSSPFDKKMERCQVESTSIQTGKNFPSCLFFALFDYIKPEVVKENERAVFVFN